MRWRRKHEHVTDWAPLKPGRLYQHGICTGCGVQMYRVDPDLMGPFDPLGTRQPVGTDREKATT